MGSPCCSCCFRRIRPVLSDGPATMRPKAKLLLRWPRIYTLTSRRIERGHLFFVKMLLTYFGGRRDGVPLYQDTLLILQNGLMTSAIWPTRTGGLSMKTSTVHIQQFRWKNGQPHPSTCGTIARYGAFGAMTSPAGIAIHRYLPELRWNISGRR